MILKKKLRKKTTARIFKLRHTLEETKEVKPNVSSGKEIHVATKISEKEETQGKTHVTTEKLSCNKNQGDGATNYVATKKLGCNNQMKKL